MLHNLIAVLFSCIYAVTIAQTNQPVNQKRYNKDNFLIEGISFSDSTREFPYDRLPFKYKDSIEIGNWFLSQASSGVSVRFFSNSPFISVYWTLNPAINQYTEVKPSQMAETGLMGIDLYCKIGNRWQFVNTARPTGMENGYLLMKNMSAEMREYKMFLPLFYGVTKLEIGIDSLSIINKPERLNHNPYVFFGSSITQGCSASHPGMAYPSIISRKINAECLNFGFNGRGKMEDNIVRILSEINAACYIIDCIPNMTVGEIKANTIPLVETIRKKHPNTPIVFLSGLQLEESSLNDSARKIVADKNKMLESEYLRIKEMGVSKVYYIDCMNALGDDHEGTVDGVHFNDLGNMRYAEFLISKLKSLKILSH